MKNNDLIQGIQHGFLAAFLCKIGSFAVAFCMLFLADLGFFATLGVVFIVGSLARLIICFGLLSLIFNKDKCSIVQYIVWYSAFIFIFQFLHHLLNVLFGASSFELSLAIPLVEFLAGVFFIFIKIILNLK